MINLSSLDTMSSNTQTQFFPVYREYLLDKCRPEHEHAAKLYEYFDTDSEFSPYKRFLNCKSKATFCRNVETGKVRVLANSCHLRFCPLCNRSKIAIIRQNAKGWIQHQKYPKFLTLTLKHNDLTLSEQIDTLYKSFAKLRRVNMFKKKIKSGIWFFQITKNEKTQQWHPHLHCVIAGVYLDQRKLSNEWRRITKTSFVVDIKLIKDIGKAADYVARYASKACNIIDYSIDELLEIDTALRNRRICGTWGTARKQKLTTMPKTNRADWQILGNWGTVFAMQKNSDIAQQIITAWSTDTVIADNVSLAAIDNFIGGKSPPPESEYEVTYE
jgi:plasmid rolling circle replication initiator protein Rep